MRERVERYLRELVRFPDRNVGSAGNRVATALFAEEAARLGLEVERHPFDCIEWECGEASLEANGEAFEIHVGPYSLACDLEAELVCATCVDELETESVRDKIVLLAGDIASGQVMPRNFTFYNPESHKRIIAALDTFAPAAVVAATGRDPGMVGSQYPFPLFEDGDLDVPNAYMKDVEGVRLARHEGAVARLNIDSRRIPTTAEQVVARRPGSGDGRIVLSAHIDSRKGSPGALDNASGVATLLAAAELLGDYQGGPSIELVPFNGEDNYANPGEMIWFADNRERFDDIVLGINVDDLGMRDTLNHVSFYGCPPEMEQAVRAVMTAHPGIEEGPQWYQSDHAILVQAGRPALAMATSDMAEFMARYAHSDRDTIDLVDAGLVVSAAAFIRDVVEAVAALESRE